MLKLVFALSLLMNQSVIQEQITRKIHAIALVLALLALHCLALLSFYMGSPFVFYLLPWLFLGHVSAIDYQFTCMYQG